MGMGRNNGNAVRPPVFGDTYNASATRPVGCSSVGFVLWPTPEKTRREFYDFERCGKKIRFHLFHRIPPGRVEAKCTITTKTWQKIFYEFHLIML